MADYTDTIDFSEAPRFPNATYRGKTKAVYDSAGVRFQRSYDVPGRAWRDERWIAQNGMDEFEGERWFFFPAGAQRKDENVFIVWHDNLTLVKQ